MEKRSQVNIEYLLLIVGAIVVVTLISLYIKSIANTLTQTANEEASKTP